MGNVPLIVKPDPTRKTTLNKRIIIAIISLQLSAFVILYLFESIHSGTGVSFLDWFYLIGSSLMFLFQLPSRKERRNWKRLEQHRQLTAQRDCEQLTLAAIQPVPDALVVSFPIILRVKNRFSTLIHILALIIIFVVSVFASGVEIILFSARFNLSVSHVSVALLFIVVFVLFECLLLFCMVNLALATLHDSQQLQFTEAGFLRRTRKKVAVVPWEEARLFAIVPMTPDGGKTDSLFTMYELSSANEVLRWSTNEHIALFVGQATLTPRERRWQMQTLLSVIAAKTKLPLYDLR